MERKVVLIVLGLLTGCAVYDPADVAECNTEVDSIEQAIITCPPRPALEPLLSPSTPNSPLIWVYNVQSPGEQSRIIEAANIWNRGVGKYIVGVAPYSSSRTRTSVPTEGVVFEKNNTYDLAGSPCSGSFVAGLWTQHKWDCNRDWIQIDNTPCWDQGSLVVRTMAHEIGHALLRAGRAGFPDHDGLNNSVMCAQAEQGCTQGTNVSWGAGIYLRGVRNRVLNEGVSVACALRGRGC